MQGVGTRMYEEQMAGRGWRQTPEDETICNCCARRVAASHQHQELRSENHSDLVNLQF